ncbi:hypothetical protein PENANT_c037G06970 [Penicillium antarcticum]|uniref:Uncharacterized protein n=1 Tax=Penicillium antarcticum TaxID=416450 RepID=A0A1V6PUS5_9EURO|nr:hypothetical protein PENANT_c037G06970 [Penicillium antarcticum]
MVGSQILIPTSNSEQQETLGGSGEAFFPLQMQIV